METSVLIHIIAIFAIVVAMATDVRRNRIYNWLTLPLLLVGFMLQVFFFRLPGLTSSLLGLLGVSAALFITFRFLGKGLGGGDIKLLLGLGALLGWPDVGWLLLYTGLSGPLIAVPVMIRYGIFRFSMENMALNFYRRRTTEGNLNVASGSKAARLPFAVSVFLGMLVLIFWSPLRSVL